MSSREFAEWCAFERLTGPIGRERDDARIALLDYHLHYQLGAKTSIDKLMLRFEPPKKETEADKQKRYEETKSAWIALATKGKNE